MKKIYFHTFILISITLFTLGCTSQAIEPVTENKVKIGGVSLVASNTSLLESHITPVTNINANYVALMPFGFIQDLNDPVVQFNSDKQWYGETTEGIQQYVTALRKQAFKIMVKPQIWVWQGAFTGDIKMDKEENWKLLEQSYTNFIIEYATVSQNLNIEMFCIGTELEQFVIHRPQFWKELISKVKNVF